MMNLCGDCEYCVVDDDQNCFCDKLNILLQGADELPCKEFVNKNDDEIM